MRLLRARLRLEAQLSLYVLPHLNHGDDSEFNAVGGGALRASGLATAQDDMSRRPVFGARAPAPSNLMLV